MSDLKSLLQKERELNGKIRIAGIVKMEIKVSMPTPLEKLSETAEKIERKWKVKKPAEEFLEERKSVM